MVLPSYQGPSVYLTGDRTNHDSWWNERSLIEQAFDCDDDKTVLYMKHLDVTATLADHVIDRIQDHHKKEDWIKFIVSECSDNEHLERVVNTAISYFCCFELADIQLIGINLIRCVSTHLVASGINPAVSTKMLERLELREIDLSFEQTCVLSEGIAKTKSLCQLNFGTVTMDLQGFRKLALGLRANQSIECVQLVRCQLNDKQVAMLAEALSNHSQLNELDITGNYCRRFGLKSLSRLLSMKNCRLRVLKLNDQYYNVMTTSSMNPSTLRIEDLLDGLQQNTSLQELQLSRNELADVDALLSILWKCPNLKTLDLLGNNIIQLASLRRFWSQSRPSRLQKLELGYNPFHYSHAKKVREENAMWLCRIFESQPELRSAGKTSYLESFWKKTCHRAKIQHFLDLNETGRVLVANNTMPLAFWPFVLERANKQFEGSRRANVLFHLLHGPVTTSWGGEHSKIS
jgi:hypothetical protein